MFVRSMQSMALACLFVGSIWAADDPFVGKWKLNQEKSKITGEQSRVESLGGNKYRYTSGEYSTTLVADGTDQPTPYGGTLSLKQIDANTWRFTYKREGGSQITYTWTLSEGGKTLTIKVHGTRPNGEDFDDEVVRTRVSPGSGIVGTWESTKFKIGSPEEWEIKPYGTDGLSFITAAEKEMLNMKFDGKDYSDRGPNVADGSTSSGRRVDNRTLEIADKIKGKAMDTAEYKVSADDKTLTVTIHNRGQKEPITVVYDRIS